MMLINVFIWNCRLIQSRWMAPKKAADLRNIRKKTIINVLFYVHFVMCCYNLKLYHLFYDSVCLVIGHIVANCYMPIKNLVKSILYLSNCLWLCNVIKLHVFDGLSSQPLSNNKLLFPYKNSILEVIYLPISRRVALLMALEEPMTQVKINQAFSCQKLVSYNSFILHNILAVGGWKEKLYSILLLIIQILWRITISSMIYKSWYNYDITDEQKAYTPPLSVSSEICQK